MRSVIRNMVVMQGGAHPLQDNRDLPLLRWRRSEVNPIAPKGHTFANIVRDASAGLYRLFTHNQGDNKIYQLTSTNLRSFGSLSLALDVGGAGAWDVTEIGTPFAWYETGASRPWRMLYRGRNTGVGTDFHVGLATSLDGITWERKDTAGEAITDKVIASGTGGDWDAGGIDIGAVIKIGSTYYCWYSRFTPRKIGYATSPDLVTWTKSGNNPVYVATVGEDVVGATPSNIRGRFCPDIVRWDTPAGTTRYAMFVPHYEADSASPSLEVYTCPNPDFLIADRSYVGTMFRTLLNPTNKQAGASITNCDTPHLITDDIGRNVSNRVSGGSEIAAAIATVNLQENDWNTELLTWHRALAGKMEGDGTITGAKYVNICTDLPVSAPVMQLSPAGTDANVRGLWVPGLTRTWMDMSGNNIHLMNQSNLIDANGGKFVAANINRANRLPTLASDPLVTVLEADRTNWSVEWTCTFASNFTTGSRSIYCHQTMTTVRHIFIYLTGGAVNYTLTAQLRSGATGRTATVTFPEADIATDTPYRFAVCQDKDNGKIYFFKNGVLLNAGGSAFDYAIDDFSAQNPPLPLNIGADSNLVSTSPWSGYIDQVRVSNVARHTTNYTPAVFTYNYQASGQIFTPVYDAGTARRGRLMLQGLTLPTGTSITVSARNATNMTDQSVTTGDFALTNPTGQYHQYLITLATTDATVSPSITGAVPAA